MRRTDSRPRRVLPTPPTPVKVRSRAHPEDLDLGQLTLAPDEARHRSGQVVTGLGRCGGGDVLSQDRQLELPQHRARLQSKVLVEDDPGTLVGGEGVRLTLSAVEDEHELRPEPLSIWVVANEALELVDQLRPTAERKIGLYALLERKQTQFLEPQRFVSQGAFVRQITEWAPTP